MVCSTAALIVSEITVKESVVLCLTRQQNITAMEGSLSAMQTLERQATIRTININLIIRAVA